MKLLDGIRFGLHATGIVVGSLAHAVRLEWRRRAHARRYTTLTAREPRAESEWRTDESFERLRNLARQS